MNKDVEILKELHNHLHWENTYIRMNTKPFSLYDLDGLYSLKDDLVQQEEIICNLMNGTYIWSIPEKKLIAKSGTKKKRVVYMYSLIDRYVLGVLYRALSVVFSDLVAPNCYSYKRRVNTSMAVIDISKTGFVHKKGLKLDIHAYFNSVAKNYLEHCLTELFGVADIGLRKTLNAIYCNNIVSFYGKEIEEYKSLIPGCALGSFFANYCLKDLDIYFYEHNIPYARYSDDIIYFADSDEELDAYLKIIKNQLSLCGLEINESKYVRFEPNEEIDFLGLKLSQDGIDISTHGKQKMKKTIKRWVRKGRREIELDDVSFEVVAKRILNRYNYRTYKCYIEDARKFGWGYYAFRYITKTDSLIEIDNFLKDSLRYLKTGKHNSANIQKLSLEELEHLGYVSLYDMYILFKTDFDYYCERVFVI